MNLLRAERLAPFGGLAFLILMAGAFVSLAAVGAEDGEPAEAWQTALVANARWAQLSGYLHGLAGLALAAFVWALGRAAALRPGGRLAPWGRYAGHAWAASFLMGGVVLFASAELAGYQNHAEGAKTAATLGHLIYANPIAGLAAAGFVLAVGLSRPPMLPAWFRPLSVAAGGLALAATTLGSVGGIGMVGFGPVMLWLVTAAVLVPWRTPR